MKKQEPDFAEELRGPEPGTQALRIAALFLLLGSMAIMVAFTKKGSGLLPTPAKQ
jgi:hypothetical protein